MKPNVLICGETGSGKSSLINFIFNENVAKVGEAEPETRGISDTPYESDTINIYDSEGYEIGLSRQQHYKKLLFDDFLSNMSDGPISHQLHAVWYVIAAGGKRITDTDSQNLIRIKEYGFPLCILLTKICEADADEFEDMERHISQKYFDIEKFNLCIKLAEGEERKIYCDLEGLLDWTRQTLPEEARENFCESLNEKTISDLGLKSMAALWFAVRNIGEPSAARLEASASADLSANEYEEALRKLQELEI